jgi:hypothetical protein
MGRVRDFLREEGNDERDGWLAYIFYDLGN